MRQPDLTIADSDAWFREAIRLHSIGETARALDAVNDTLDDWLAAGEFGTCDAFLARIDAENTPAVLLLAILTVAYHAREKLGNRVTLDRWRQAIAGPGATTQPTN